MSTFNIQLCLQAPCCQKYTVALVIRTHDGVGNIRKDLTDQSVLSKEVTYKATGSLIRSQSPWIVWILLMRGGSVLAFGI